MKRMASLLLCAALTVSTLTGCAGAPKKPYTPSGSGLTMEDDITPTLPPQEKPEQLLTLAYYPQRSLNPYESTDVTNRALFSLLYQGLFSVDRDYTVQPVLCKRYTVSDDMLTYVFYPEAAVFSDGSTLTAGDVAASLRAASQSTYYSGRFTHVDTIALTNGGGVSVTLNTPHENLPLLLDIPIVKQNQTGLDRPAGTGPYEFASGDGGLRLRKRADWWCEAELAIYADPITLIEAESNAHIRDQFEFADVGLVCTNPCTDTYADYRCDYELWDCENGVFLYLGCNMYSKVFSKPAVRSALTYAIDREKLASEYYRGFGRSATLPLSPRSPWYSESLAQEYEYDKTRFTQALTAANLKGSQVNLLVNRGDTLRLRAARAIAEMLESCGLKVTVVDLEARDYQDAYRAGMFDLYLGQTKLSANMDLSAFFSPWGVLSYGGMDDSTIYAMCKEALENSGNYYNLSQMIMDDGRLCPVLFSSYAVYADRGLISGLEPSRDDVFHYDLGRTLEDALDTHGPADAPIPTETEDPSAE